MAQDMTEKELLKMELDQLKKEVKNERQMVSIAPECKTGSNLGTLRMLMGHTLQIHVSLREREPRSRPRPRMLMGHTTAKGSSAAPSPRGPRGSGGR